MSDIEPGWRIDDGPDEPNCDIGEHEWEAADCDNCDNPECHVICANCNEFEYLCGGGDDA